MVDLNFHCCMCGEENEQAHFIERKYDEEQIITMCDYCNEQLFIDVANVCRVLNVNGNY